MKPEIPERCPLARRPNSRRQLELTPDWQSAYPSCSNLRQPNAIDLSGIEDESRRPIANWPQVK
jgi:hypothetical protein